MMSENIKVVLVDDHNIVRDGIKSLIKGMKDIEVTGEASSGAELKELLQQLSPDLIIMDISLPDISGIELTSDILNAHPLIRVLMLSMYLEEDFIFNSLKAGAKGYLPKNTSRKELENAIKAVSAGEEYFSPAVSDIILRSYVKKARKNEGPKEIDILSKREVEVLKMFAQGKSNQEIADAYCISIRTVESHKNHIMHKLELKSTIDLVKFAIRNKVVDV
jgi:DNA-binding NarL/FixJ family response regulator